jgi:hypothetical protein
MAIKYQIMKDKGLVVITTSGGTTSDEIKQSFEKMYADPEYVSEYDQLWDDAERTTVFTLDDMRGMMRHFRLYKGDKSPKRAIVVSRADKYGMTRLFEMLMSISSSTRIGVFSERAEALKWLGR